MNGKLVPLRYQLQSGDTVEIITTREPGAVEGLAQAGEDVARQGAHPRLREGPAEPALGGGGPRDPGARPGATPSRPREAAQGRHARARARASSRSRDEEALLADVGYGKLTAQQVLAKIFPEEELERRREQKEGALQRLMRLVSRQPKSGVRVSGVEDMLVRFGKCCQPLPGERIAGFITRGRGVTVHAQDCPEGPRDRSAAARRRAVGERQGHAARGAHRGDVRRPARGCWPRCRRRSARRESTSRAPRCTRSATTRPQNTFELMVGSMDELNLVMRNLGRVRGVMKVHRVRE